MESAMSTIENRPAFFRSIVRLSCSACGAEANASCNCGQPYVPVRERAAEAVRANPEKSNRAIAEEHGFHPEVVRRARGDTGVSPETVTGRDGKSYPAGYQREPGGEIARLKRVYGEDLRPQPIQKELKAAAVGACEQMNLPTLQAFALDFDRIYSARREGDT
jgi:hypothetical protein